MQTFSVHVQPKAKRDCVESLDSTHFRVTTVKPALDGAANDAVITLLAKHLHVKKSQLFIRSGEKSRHKVIALIA